MHIAAIALDRWLLDPTVGCDIVAKCIACQDLRQCLNKGHEYCQGMAGHELRQVDRSYFNEANAEFSAGTGN